jgi:hypothetical protein
MDALDMDDNSLDVLGSGSSPSGGAHQLFLWTPPAAHKLTFTGHSQWWNENVLRKHWVGILVNIGFDAVVKTTGVLNTSGSGMTDAASTQLANLWHLHGAKLPVLFDVLQCKVNARGSPAWLPLVEHTHMKYFKVPAFLRQTSPAWNALYCASHNLDEYAPGLAVEPHELGIAAKPTLNALGRTPHAVLHPAEWYTFT